MNNEMAAAAANRRWPLLAAAAAFAVMLALGGYAYIADLAKTDAASPSPVISAAQAPAGSAAAVAPAPAGNVAQGAAPTAAKPAAATPGSGQASLYEALQHRLDAIAKAYNDGDPQAAERAMWPNHAVVRPNGDTLDRSALLGQWMTEWDRFSKRKLSFAIDEVHVDGASVTATWSMELTAEILGPDSEMHEFEARGTQRATYDRSGAVETLAGPIVYTGYEQTIDGMTYKPAE